MSGRSPSLLTLPIIGVWVVGGKLRFDLMIG